MKKRIEDVLDSFDDDSAILHFGALSRDKDRERDKDVERGRDVDGPSR